MKFYYADAQNQTDGPVTLETLQELVRTGTLKNDPMVIPEGGAEWKHLSTFAGAESQPPMPGPSQRRFASRVPSDSLVPFSRTILGDLVATPLKSVRNWLNIEFTKRTLEVCRDAGHFAILAGGALGLIYCIVTAIKGNQLIPALIGVGFVVALAIAQFVAMQFLGAGDALIANTPHRISSQAFLECFGLFSLLMGLGLLASGIFLGIKLGGLGAVMMIAVCVALAFSWVYQAALAFNPAVVNISIGAGGAGEEAVGILGFSLKASLKQLPIFFLFTAILGDLMIVGSFSSRAQPMSGYGGDPFVENSPLGGLLALNSMFGNYSGIVLVLLACLLPFLGYFLFLLFNLGLEVIKAILSLTGETGKSRSV